MSFAYIAYGLRRGGGVKYQSAYIILEYVLSKMCLIILVIEPPYLTKSAYEASTIATLNLPVD